MTTNKLTIQLRQHTPLIHFQHDQAGATLRATEVKPKLDRFILTELGNGNYDEGLKKAKENKWLIGDTQALDYKLHFFISEDPVISIINKVKEDKNGNEKKKIRKEDGREIYELNTYPLYFGNLDKDIEDATEYKKFSFLNNPFEMKIFTFHSSLLTFFTANSTFFSSFFSQNNFGSRQSKGFGSFYIDENDKSYKPITSKYQFTIDGSKQNSWSDLFKTIDLFYKSLRSGINLKNRDGETIFYFKSLLFLYFKSKNIQWDKKSIKERFFNSDLKKQQTEHDNPDILIISSVQKKLVKDLLGLSTNESWKSYSKTVTKTNDDIDRFKSPIIFKPIRMYNAQFKVYLYFESVNPDFLNKAFNINVGSGSLSLFTPKEFSVRDFFQWILNEEHFNIQSHVDSDFHRHSNFKILDKIYKQLRETQKTIENAG